MSRRTGAGARRRRQAVTRPAGEVAEVRIGGAGDFQIAVERDHACFAPTHEAVAISWTLTDPQRQATGVRVELWGTLRRGRRVKICYWEPEAGNASWWTEGRHSFLWDGRTQGAGYEAPPGWRGDGWLGPDELPDGHVTARFSPYVAKVFVRRAGGEAAVAAAPPVEVRVHEVSLRLGPLAWAPEERERAALTGVDEDLRARTVRLLIDADLFKPDDDAMYAADALHDAHRALWDAGPRVPLLARATVRTSAGAGVELPAVLRGSSLLWEVVDVLEGRRPRDDFVGRALAFHTTATRPTGDNCHAERGGRRDAISPCAFEAVPGDGGRGERFAAHALDRRRWSLVTDLHHEGPHAGATAALLRASRMGGDTVKVRVYALARDENNAHDLDHARALPADRLLGESPAFQTWRKVDLWRFVARHRRLAEAGRRAPLRDMTRRFQEAFVHVQLRTGGLEGDGSRVPRVLTAEQWQARAERWVEGLPGRRWDLKLAFARSAHAPPAGTDDDAAGAGVFLLPFSDWYRAARARPMTPQQVFDHAGVRLDAADERGSLLRLCYWYLVRQQGWAKEVLEQVVAPDLPAQGLGLFHCKGVSNHWRQLLEVVPEDEGGGRYLQGWAPSLPASSGPGGALRSAAFILCSPPLDDEADDATTLAHEIGHLLYLSHAPNGVPAAANPDSAHHDARCGTGGVRCIMGYEGGRRAFCGLCQLKLRGWKVSALSNDAAANEAAR